MRTFFKKNPSLMDITLVKGIWIKIMKGTENSTDYFSCLTLSTLIFIQQ